MITPDSSVVIAALAPWHNAHAAALDALREVRTIISHVAYETTSVLSRLPRDRRSAPTTILAALQHNFPDPWLALDGAEARRALERAVGQGIRGGALYDALIAATAAQHGARLLSADTRARATYQALGVEVVRL